MKARGLGIVATQQAAAGTGGPGKAARLGGRQKGGERKGRFCGGRRCGEKRSEIHVVATMVFRALYIRCASVQASLLKCDDWMPWDTGLLDANSKSSKHT